MIDVNKFDFDNCVLRVGDKEFLLNDFDMTIEKDVSESHGIILDAQVTITFESDDEIFERERRDNY